ncbi:MAG: xanthine dehydrogenase family protein molybdopterin-binding subunit [Candidatus Thiodiazotropha sp. 6PLUC9]
MNTKHIVNLSRRRFLAGSAVSLAGLTLGVIPTVMAEQRQAGPGIAGRAPEAAGDFSPNAFLRIDKEGVVTVISKHLEMGQGTYTGLATLVAEELDADWNMVRVEGAPADAARYNNLFWGKVQGTGGSTAMANSWEQMRRAGAAARAMLIQAASKQWQVPADQISVSSGVIKHSPTGRQADFGALAELAAQQPVPESVELKDPKSFKLIGKRIPRKDTAEKINGQAQFTQDIDLPGLLTALVLHPPKIGMKVKQVDSAKALEVKGVRKVVELSTGVAVVADDFWGAKLARDRLSVTWDDSGAFDKSSEQILNDYRKMAQEPGLEATKKGSASTVLAAAESVLEAEYSVPFLSHSAMEPMNCVVRIDAEGCDIWNGEQMQTSDQQQVAGLLGLEPKQVHIHMLYAGGSFGRRANPAADYVLEAVNIAKSLKPGTPVKMIWTREDDTHGGYYRPIYLHRMRATQDEQGAPHAWEQRIVGQSILKGTPFELVMVKDGVDMTSVEGAANLPYEIKHIQVDLHSPELPVSVLWWRSVGSSHTAFAVECFIDELAVKAGEDPLTYRRKLLGNHPRHLAVLNLAAEKAGWGEPLGRNRGQGIAVHESFNSYVAQVAEVSVRRGVITVDRVVIAVDCGIAINPDIIEAQMQGGMGFGLSAALFSELTFKNGAVEQSNFNDYRVLRIDQMPEVEVHIVASAEPPTGVGEPATPVIAPAVANAVFAATGQRLRQLPLRLS